MSANDPIHVEASSRHRNVYDATMQAMEAGSTNARIDALGEKIDDLRQRFEGIEGRFDRLQLTILAGALGIIAALIAGIIGIVAALIGFN